MITGEIINPWTGGKLQLSEEIDDNSAQEGEYNCLFTYFFTVNQNYRKVHIIIIMSPFVTLVKPLFVRYDLQFLI